MMRYRSPVNLALTGAVMKFLGNDNLSPGFLHFLESRSLLLRVSMIATCWLGAAVIQIWPFSLLRRFIRANALLFEDADRPAQIVRLEAGSGSQWKGRNFDVIVVGSGPGGSVSALRHIERGKTVLLVEEGPDVSVGLDDHHSVSQAQVQLRDLGFQVIYGSSPVAFAQGRTVGGGSEVNSGLYHRVPEPYRSKLLAAIDCSESDWALLESRVESALGVQKAPVRYLSKYSESARDFVTGCKHMGLVVEEIPRWRKYEPEIHNGMKNTYLAKFLEKGGVLVSQQTVTRLTEHPNHVRVEMSSESGKISVTCSEVVLAAGAIETVRLLRNSGIVRKLVFPLGFHPMVRVLAEHDMSVNDDGHFPPYQSWDASHDIKLGFSVSTYNYLRATYAALTGKVVGAEKLSRLLAYFASFSLKDSRAYTLVLSRKAISGILWGAKDKRKIRVAETMLADALVAGGAKEVVRGEGKPTISTVHLFGSLPLGSSSLVDSMGKVSGSSRVFVSDASLMPVAPWVNPQGPIMVLCELVASRKLVS